MTIELTDEQARAVAIGGDELIVIDPGTKQAYRLVPEEVFNKVRALIYDDSPWTPGETALLAGAAFGKLDDTDYGDYLRDIP